MRYAPRRLRRLFRPAPLLAVTSAKTVVLKETLDQLEHLEEALKHCAAEASCQVVQLGSHVWIKDGQTTRCVTLMPRTHFNPFESEIAVNSPLGKALLGKHCNDVARVLTSGGSHAYVITGIE